MRRNCRIMSSCSAPPPCWRDLEGYYTRYGDVGELLESVDDRYVIMNAGDELRLRFAAPGRRLRAAFAISS